MSGRTAPFTSVIVPEGATFPAVCCAGVCTPSLFPLHNSSGRWMQCEVKVALCTFNGVQVGSEKISFSGCSVSFIVTGVTKCVWSSS